jgi:hypothetical protein
MKLLTHKDILAMSKQERVNLLDRLQDEACNIDYVLNPIHSDFVHRNISALESKIIYNEY